MSEVTNASQTIIDPKDFEQLKDSVRDLEDQV